MNRKWLTGLALASVAGTGGVAYVAVAAPHSGAAAAAQAPAPLPDTSATTTGTSAVRTFSYQVGDAGTVTVDVQGTALAGRKLDPAAGWSVREMSNTGAHLDVQLTDSNRIVGFVADLVGPDVVVSVTNSLVPGSTATSRVSHPTGSVVNAATPVATTLPATTLPATPVKTMPSTPATTAAVPATAPAVRPAPSAAATTATSSAGTPKGDDGAEHNDDHATEYGAGHDD